MLYEFVFSFFFSASLAITLRQDFSFFVFVLHYLCFFILFLKFSILNNCMNVVVGFFSYEINFVGF